MKAEFYKVRGTEMEEMMKRGNNNFGANHMWVSEKESGKRLILVEF